MTRTVTQEYAIGDNAACAAAHMSAAGNESGEKMRFDIGPLHPATNGVLRLRLELDGDIVTRCDTEIGYLHRGVEKAAESLTYNQFVPYADRLDCLAPLAGNVAYALAVEKLAALEVPPRCAAIRVVCCELGRLASHLSALGACAENAGARLVCAHTATEREKLHTLFEELSGGRVTTNYTRIGGVARDIPEGWSARVVKFCDALPGVLADADTLLARNQIFLTRTKGVARITSAEAIAHGLTGPNLRASGVPADLRKDRPYSGYENYEFDVPVGTVGDCYDRYLVRMEEMYQSLSIVRQAVEKMPGGLWYNDAAWKIFPPPKERVHSETTVLIGNFMLATRGPQLPAGEIYFETESPRGSLGFFIHSKGGGVPWRLHIRSGSFMSLGVLQKIAPGHHLSGIPVILNSLDFVVGECDR